MLTLYGIPNCDACRKARRWLDAHAVESRFHDLRLDGVTRALLVRWAEDIGWQQLLNKRSTTWRQLAESRRSRLTAGRAIELMLEFPTLIKRPVLDADGRIAVGFSEDDYRKLLA